MYRKTPNQKQNSARYYIKRKSRQEYKCLDCGRGVSQRGRRCNPCAHRLKRSEYGKSLGEGRCLNIHGYIMLRVNGKYVPESRYIWEQYYNKPIPAGWQVHHLDGDKTNNNVQNLYACSKHDHLSNKFTQVLVTRIKTLQDEIEQLKANGHSLW